MRTIEIFDNNYSPDRSYDRIRRAVRAVILENNRIYIEYASKGPIIMLPGGGVEDGEGKEECVVRECAEECGLVVKPLKQLFVIKEYYKDVIFDTTYMLCETVGNCSINLTPNETLLCMRSYYQDLQTVVGDLKQLLGKIEDKESQLYGMNYREFIALNEILNTVQNRK